MKPKDLKSPFTWNTRYPCSANGVVYVPEYYFEHDQSIMPKLPDMPICVEFCSGNGDWIIARAQAEPEKFWIAVEMQFCRVRKIWSKRENHGLKNLLIVCGKAEDFLDHYIQGVVFDEAYINFPDPWEKDRQAKHRIVQEPFMGNLKKKMKSGGTATLVTDHEVYAKQMSEVMQASWEPQEISSDISGYGYSFFADLFIKQEKNISKQVYVNS
ncbi:MAG: tRNA (guanosine(46)-N7)-methyltransferase TrmB [Simkaniaceae bacterium]|nr:tRNA (guanosine(46)-N7)-methyltransferase TrmB [Simkaniaceae bacterium]